MKHLLYLIIASTIILGCSKDEETNYLTSVERAKEGIVGTWRCDVGEYFFIEFTVEKDSVFYTENTREYKGKWNLYLDQNSYFIDFDLDNYLSKDYHYVLKSNILKLTSKESTLLMQLSPALREQFIYNRIK